MRRTGREILADHTLEIDAPKSGFPSNMKISLRVEKNDGGLFFIDGLRLSGWQDWQVPAIEWRARGDAAFSEGTAVLKGGNASVPELGKALDGTALSVVELGYRFTGNEVGAGDRLLVELHDGKGWKTVAEHDDSYVLLPGTGYAGKVTLRQAEHRFSPTLLLRFRLEGESSDRRIRIDNLHAQQLPNTRGVPEFRRLPEGCRILHDRP